MLQIPEPEYGRVEQGDKFGTLSHTASCSQGHHPEPDAMCLAPGKQSECGAQSLCLCREVSPKVPQVVSELIGDSAT
jgi:hypothetical protein